MKSTYKLLVLLGGVFGVLGVFQSACAATTAGVTGGNETQTTVSWEITDAKGQRVPMLVDDAKQISLRAKLQIDPGDVGIKAALYKVYLGHDTAYQQTSAGKWISWDNTLAGLLPFKTQTLRSSETIDVLMDEALSPGEFKFDILYRRHDGSFVYSKIGQALMAFEAGEPGLHRFAQSWALHAYFREAMQMSIGSPYYAGCEFGGDCIDFAPVAPPKTNFNPTPVSGTNLQEAGVDEADIIKTDGRYLYKIDTSGLCKQDSCIDFYRIAEKPAVNEEVDGIVLDSKADALYLIKQKPEKQAVLRRSDPLQDLLIGISGQDNVYYHSGLWWDPWGWDGKFTAQWIEVTSPDNPKITTKIEIGATLVSSRRIGENLYLVLRNSPQIRGFEPWADSDAEKAKNEEILAATKFDDFFPSITFDEKKSVPLVASEDCYLPPAKVDKVPNPSMLFVVAIPVNAPEAFQSLCIMGSSETVYMSSKNLYLATTKHDYAVDFATGRQMYDPEITTEIHKIGFDGLTLEYLGSGAVTGHLGWEMDKKSFRMGEYQDAIHVFTSVGSQWNDSSSTRLSILKETPKGGSLEETGAIEGLGKPGEQLYAARILGSRAYLVTFKKIDPLYVIDISDSKNPQVMGELLIEGYSDYLHPVDEKLLLGIGKDAVPAEGWGDGDFSWYQGIKIALFDVSDPTQPSEVRSVVIGKRGTTAPVLSDHHAISYLPPNQDGVARIALPVETHRTPPIGSWWDPTQPNAHYNWTSTGLHVFDILVGDHPALTYAGRIVAQDNQNGGVGDEGDQFAKNHRSVLLGESVHYTLNGSVESAALARRRSFSARNR